MRSSGVHGVAGVQDAFSAFANVRTIEQRESSRTIPRRRGRVLGINWGSWTYDFSLVPNGYDPPAGRATRFLLNSCNSLNS
jgi:hypothetical protein